MPELLLLAELLFQPVPYRDLRYEWVVGQADWYTCGLPQRRTGVLLRRLDRGAAVPYNLLKEEVVEMARWMKVLAVASAAVVAVPPAFAQVSLSLIHI